MAASAPFLVTCTPCSEIFKIATLPIEAAELVKVANDARCPACGASGRALKIANAADAAAWHARQAPAPPNYVSIDALPTPPARPRGRNP